MNALRKLQAIFQTLADYNRLNMIKSIGDKECPVGEIVSITGLSQPLVSHHLKTLKENGFLETKRKGPFIYYYLRDKQILVALDIFIEIFRDTQIQVSPEFRFCPEWMMKRFKNLK